MSTPRPQYRRYQRVQARARCRYYAREMAWAFLTVAILIAFAWVMGWALSRPWVGVTTPLDDALRPDLTHARRSR